MKRILLFVPFVICLVLGVVFYKGIFQEDKEALPSALIGKPLPTFILRTVIANELKDTNDMKGAPALVNVWATWCPSCRIEHPDLITLSQQGVKIFGVNYKDDMFAAQEWLAKLGNPYVFSIQDGDGLLGVDLGVYGAPETFLIDHQGNIRLKYVGVFTLAIWESKFKALYDQLNVELQQQ